MLAAAFFTTLACTAVAAEDAAGYPSRPITVVVGYPPGGATDIIARLVATKLSQSLGQPVIVENKPGAGSNIATEQVVRAKPDGYTLLVETIANATNMTVYKNIKYDSARDLAPIVQFMSSPSVLVRVAVAQGDRSQVADRAGQGRAGQADLCLVRRRRLAPPGG